MRSEDRAAISSWLSRHPGSLARFRVRVNDLGKIARSEWNIKQFRYIKNGDGLAEIKWKWSDREWRAFGYFDHEDFFLMVMGCTHKESYDPPDCLNTAKRKMQEAKRGEWGIRNYEP